MLRLLSLILLCLGCSFALRADPAAALEKLYADYWEESLRLFPFQATFAGDNRFNDAWGPVTSSAANEATRALTEKYLAALKSIDTSAIEGEAQISLDLFQRRLTSSLENLKYPSHLLPISQVQGIHQFFAQLASGSSVQPFATIADFDNWLKRASFFPASVDGAIADMREGIRTGVVLPKALAQPVIPQLEQVINAPAESSILLACLSKLPADAAEPEKQRIRSSISKMVQEEILPAYRRLLEFMMAEYLPACRDTIGLSALPEGKAWYAYQISDMANTQLTPDQIHEIGLAEVSRLLEELALAARAAGFTGSTQDYIKHLAEAPEYRFNTRAEIQATYEAYRPKVAEKLSRFFSRMPATEFEIRQVEQFREATAPPASYMPGSPDGSRKGVFYFNSYKPETRIRFNTLGIYLHEAEPGHHFELSLSRELTEIPMFRKFSFNTAYSEGWALYTERLGDEMGLYDDPLQRVGMITNDLWRAVRLVVDTGIHAKGWSREQAIDYFDAHVPQGRGVAVQEVDRYIAWPAQALTYKIGMLKIQELRLRAELELGRAFDLRAFHEEVLRHGSLPLDVLEQAVNRWLVATRNASPHPRT